MKSEHLSSAQIGAIVADIRLSLKKATDAAWRWQPGEIDRSEEQYVASLIESAFDKTQVLTEMLNLPETLRSVREHAQEARKDYAATEFAEELFLKWPSKLGNFLDVIQARTSNTPQTTVEELADILRRVPAGLSHWTWEYAPRVKGYEARHWHVDHEYHVQNLLWFLLAPLFPDAQRESHLPQVGGLSPRPDILIPSMKLVVEIKFLRDSQKTDETIRAIAEDRGLYINDESDCSAIIAFIWDNSRRSELHPRLIQGLKKIDDVVDAIVVSRPGIMKDAV